MSSKNYFNEAAKLINDIRDDTKNVKPGFGNKKVFDDLEKLINDISNNKVKKESEIKRIEKKFSRVKATKANKSTVFQNKMIYVVYYLFNSFGLGKKPLLFKGKKPRSIKTTKMGKCKQRNIY